MEAPPPTPGPEVVDCPPQPAFRLLAHRFAQLTGLELAPRRANLVDGRTSRQDTLFHALADLAFEGHEGLTVVVEEAPGWLVRCPSETLQALLGYLSYCQGEYGRATGHFLACVRLAPHNLDNYLDLAFALQHQGDALSGDLLFDHTLFVEACCQHQGAPLTLAHLRLMAKTFREQHSHYAQTWPLWAKKQVGEAAFPPKH